MLALFINIINVSFLIYLVTYHLSRRIDTSLLWYSLISLFFINIPLLWDNILLLIYGSDEACKKLVASGNNWNTEYFNYLLKISTHSLIFNCCFYFSYRFVSYRKLTTYKFPRYADSDSYFPWYVYFLISYGAFFLFLFHNGITYITNMGTTEWYANRGSNRLINLMVNILIPMSSVSVLVMLHKKQYLYGLIAMLPILLVGYISGARALIIGLVMYMLYYYLMKSSLNINKKKLMKLVVLAFSAVFLMTFFRKSEFNIFPMNKDISYEDLFYTYAHADSYTTEGTNTIRLILTGFYPYKAEDVTAVLAAYKYFDGWGTLHPTLLGWAYTDLLNAYWLLAVFLGGFISFCDRLRHNLKQKYNILLLAFIFSFLSIAVRGSVQYGYATIIYPVIIFFVLSFLKQYRKCVSC